MGENHVARGKEDFPNRLTVKKCSEVKMEVTDNSLVSDVGRRGHVQFSVDHFVTQGPPFGESEIIVVGPCLEFDHRHLDLLLSGDVSFGHSPSVEIPEV